MTTDKKKEPTFRRGADNHWHGTYDGRSWVIPAARGSRADDLWHRLWQIVFAQSRSNHLIGIGGGLVSEDGRRLVADLLHGATIDGVALTVETRDHLLDGRPGELTAVAIHLLADAGYMRPPGGAGAEVTV